MLNELLVILAADEPDSKLLDTFLLKFAKRIILASIIRVLQNKNLKLENKIF